MFSKVTVIIDLFLSAARGLFGIIGLASIFAYPEVLDQFGPVLAYGEVSSALLVGIFGILAGVFLLLKKRAGLVLGSITVILTLVHLVVSALEIPSMAPAGVEGYETISYIAGAGFVLVIRVALLILYLIALRKAANWFSNQAA